MKVAQPGFYPTDSPLGGRNKRKTGNGKRSGRAAARRERGEGERVGSSWRQRFKQRQRPHAHNALVQEALGDADSVLRLFYVQRLPVDPIQQHQQHHSEVLRRRGDCCGLVVDDLHGLLRPPHRSGHLAAGEERVARRVAFGQHSQLRWGVDESGQCQTRPVLGDGTGTVFLCFLSGPVLRDSPAAGGSVVWSTWSFNCLFHWCVGESGELILTTWTGFLRSVNCRLVRSATSGCCICVSVLQSLEFVELSAIKPSFTRHIKWNNICRQKALIINAASAVWSFMQHG